ncbi:hypothetical protein TWF225_012099 [Orbilia oligospora]|nr:hypothetical protein TWF225_012099 [Orbilia oligospora]KAF3254757.1 hypothetical protein TWF128_012094 [Orbilia oligospora]KAF3290540.1 hypothetical protein TWF132_012103 [Orbilia oligospora]
MNDCPKVENLWNTAFAHAEHALKLQLCRAGQGLGSGDSLHVVFIISPQSIAFGGALTLLARRGELELELGLELRCGSMRSVHTENMGRNDRTEENLGNAVKRSKLFAILSRVSVSQAGRHF